MTQPNNPLPSELRDDITDALTAFMHDVVEYEKSNPVNLDLSFKQAQARMTAAFEQEYQRRSNEMLDRLESKYGEAIDYSLSQEPFKFVALSDIEAERGNLKQLSEGDKQ